LVTKKRRKLKNKRILITAGPTWVRIDKVRLISNAATGRTGILLSERLVNSGAKVTLLLGPGQYCCLDKKINLIRFKFFVELKNLIEKELKSKKYDIVIHSAAVSDYKPAKAYNYKIKSGLRSFQIKLVPTLKIIDLIKKISPDSLVVGFKFEPDAGKRLLIEKSRALMLRANLDFVVTNSIKDNKYLAYIINHKKSYGPMLNKDEMTDNLIKLIGGSLWKG
jgi:phosphopantothenoylcysteine decarboxylase/phosphopantothenate--cysteine ligase